MISWGPQTFIASNQATGYLFGQTSLPGFPLINQEYNVTHTSFLPYPGTVSSSPGTNSYAATFSNTNEEASPGYYQVTTNSNVKVQLTTTTHAGDGLFTFNTGGLGSILLTTNNTVTITPGASVVSGEDNNGTYFYAVFTRSIASYGVWSGSNLSSGATSASGTNSGAYLTFDTSINKQVQVVVGLSFVSASQAQKNLDQEILNQSLTFSIVQANANTQWNNALGKVAINDPNATTSELTVFYSALYRALLAPTVFSDVDGHYLGWDNTIRTVESGHTNEYTTFTSWDDGHGGMMFPFLALLFQKEANDMIQSYVDMGVQSDGFARRLALGTWVGNSNRGDYALPAEAYAFGATGFDANAGLNLLYNNATNPNNNPTRFGLSYYLSNGYVPSDKGVADSVEQTQSYAIADFATAQLARTLGVSVDYNDLMQRVDNWRNEFNTSYSDNGYSGYMWGRASTGSFDSFTGSNTGDGDTYWQEASAAQESWWVPQNLNKLISLMGGTTQVQNRLNFFFTGLNDGQGSYYAYMGNEPDFPTPWIYDWANDPAGTQSTVRAIQSSLYLDAARGTPGNDDWGAMATFYVWASLGLYPEIPGIGGFALNSPLFSSAILTLDNSHQIVINANGASWTNKFVSGLTLDGNGYNSSWLPLSSLVNGSSTHTLSFSMSTNTTSWGTHPTSNIPPSYGAVVTPAGTKNLVINPGFEADGVATASPSGWTVWNDPASTYTENKCLNCAHTGDYNLTEYNGSRAYTVSVYQPITGLSNGSYTLSAYVRSSGGQTTAYMSAKNCGPSEIKQPISASSSWTLITLPVNVTTGQCQIHFYSQASAGQWLNVDDVAFYAS